MNIYITTELTQFNIAPKIANYNIFQNPQLEIQNGVLVSNCDFFICGGSEKNIIEKGELGLIDYSIIRRYKKSDVIIYFNNMFKSDKNYIKPLVFELNNDIIQKPFNCEKSYYMKLEYGARSINIFKIPKNTNISLFYTEFKKAIDSKINDRVFSCLEKFNISRLDPNENYQNESNNNLNGEYYLHEEIYDIESEYRIISSGTRCYVYKRQRSENGVDKGITKILKNEVGMFNFVSDKLLKNNYIGSIDLVVTKDNKYSIVEGSSQFSMEELPHTEKYDIIKETLDYITKKALK